MPRSAASRSGIQCSTALVNTASNSRVERQRLRVELARVETARDGGGHELGRRIGADHDGARLHELLGERAVAAADVEDALARPRRQQVEHRLAEVRHEARVGRVVGGVPRLAAQRLRGSAVATSRRPAARRRRSTPYASSVIVVERRGRRRWRRAGTRRRRRGCGRARAAAAGMVPSIVWSVSPAVSPEVSSSVTSPARCERSLGHEPDAVDQRVTSHGLTIPDDDHGSLGFREPLGPRLMAQGSRNL